MKYIKFFLITLATAGSAPAVFSQNINWRSLEKGQRHVANLYTGWDYSMSFGGGYAYQLGTKIPAALNLAFSIPSGKELLDDHKTKIGGQVELVRLGHFSATARLHGIVRRYQSSLVRIASFGSEISGTAGYYRTRWFVAGECGFDKAIATHLRHRPAAREDFPGIQDGWYVPTAGNFSFGVQGGLAFGRYDAYMRLGRVVSQDFKTTPLIPFYFQVGMNSKF